MFNLKKITILTLATITTMIIVGQTARALENVYDPNPPHLAFEEPILSIMYDGQPGYCKYFKPLSVGGGDNWGIESRRDTCFNRGTYVAYCPNFMLENKFYVERNQYNCSCTKANEGWPIQFGSDVSRLASKEFNLEKIEKNCTLSKNINSDENRLKLFLEKSLQMKSFYLSTEGYKYMAIGHVDGCIKHCRNLGEECINFFLNNGVASNFKDEEMYIYSYNHPIFGPIKASSEMIMKMMKKNEEILINKGYPQCGHYNLPNILNWPKECKVSQTDPGTSFRPATDDTCNRSKPSQHCYGKAIDISCQETVGANPNGCGATTTKALEIIKEYWNKNIIVECTPTQIRDAHRKYTSDSIQVIHLDLR